MDEIIKAAAEATSVGATLLGTAKLVDTKTFQKLYTDALSNAVKEIGGTLTNVAKTGKLVSNAMYQQVNHWFRFVKMIDEAAAAVPEKRRIPSPPEIAGAIFEHSRHIDEDSPARKMFVNLLAISIDSAKRTQAHPAFPQIISQLSRDEAIVLKIHTSGDRRTTSKRNRSNVDDKFTKIFWNKEFILEHLAFPELYDVYLSRLEAMGLFTLTERTFLSSNRAIPTQSKSIRNDFSVVEIQDCRITDFGKLFRAACIHKDDEIEMASKNPPRPQKFEPLPTLILDCSKPWAVSVRATRKMKKL